MNLFQIASSDQSVYYLGQIFGYVGSVLQGSTGSLLLGSMFKTINTTALVLGALLITHTTVVGLLKTASEGQFLGKEWSSLWMPIRTVIGIGSLFPTASGYSVLQVVMMWLILQGIGAADTLWTTTLNYVAVAGSPYATINLPTVSINANMQTLFQGLVCESAAEETDTIQNPNQTPYYYCGDSANYNNGTCFTAPSVMTTNLGPSGACGNFSYCDANALCTGTDANGNPNSTSLACVACNAQIVALTSIMTTLRGPSGVAGLFESTDHQYITLYENTSPTPPRAPAWVLAYCSAHTPQIAQNACCLFDPPNSCTPGPNSSNPCPVSSCTSKFAGLFYSDSASSAGSADYTNAGQDVVAQAYLPYALQPTLGNQVTFINAAVTLYVNTIGQAVSAWIQQQPPQLTGWEQEAQENGWILAGAFYYKMASQNNQNLQSAMPTFTANSMQMNSTLAEYRNNSNAALSLMDAISNLSSGSGGSSLPVGASSVTSGFQSAAFGIEDSLMSTISSGNGTNNPLASLQAFGESLLITAEVGYPILLILSSVLVAAGVVDPMVLGSGITQNPMGGWFTAFFNLLNPLLLAFFAFCISFGGMLAIYTPFIPYIIFTTGAIGWITTTIEAMVAMPFVALGILSPGHSEILGRAEPAVMIILNIFLRPTLMIIGMMAGMLMAVVVVTMINAGFQEVMGSIFPGTGAHGPVEIVLFICVYTSLIITSLNKCFALIYLIPDRVLTYIGGAPPPSGGEAEALGEVKKGAEAAADATGGALASAAAAVAGSAASAAKKGLEDRKAAKVFQAEADRLGAIDMSDSAAPAQTAKQIKEAHKSTKEEKAEEDMTPDEKRQARKERKEKENKERDQDA